MKCQQLSDWCRRLKFAAVCWTPSLALLSTLGVDPALAQTLAAQNVVQLASAAEDETTEAESDEAETDEAETVEGDDEAESGEELDATSSDDEAAESEEESDEASETEASETSTADIEDEGTLEPRPELEPEPVSDADDAASEHDTASEHEPAADDEPAALPTTKPKSLGKSQRRSAAGSTAPSKANKTAKAGQPGEVASLDLFAALDLSTIKPESLSRQQAATFNFVQPGKTKFSALQKRWGEPLRIDEKGTQTAAYYQLHGFRQIDVLAEKGVVKSLVLHLDKPMSVESFSQKLGFEGVRAVAIKDELGTQLGVGFPESGLLCGFRDPAKKEVTEVVIEPITGELFRLRAEQSYFQDFQRDLQDLDQAIALQQNDADAHWQRAELLAMAGKFTEALTSAEQATKLKPDHALYQLTLARLHHEAGDTVKARTETKAIADRTTEQPAVRALAAQQMGDLLAVGPDADVPRAMEQHMQAIELAASLLNEPRFAQRRLAKRVLVNSHLAVALDVALGNFQKREEAIPKWLQQATDLAEDYITQDGGDPSMKMHIYRTTLQAFATIAGSMNPSIAAEAAISDARQMMAESDDKIYQARIEMLLAETLFHAARIERLRGESASCKNYINNALALLEPHQDTQQSPYDRYLVGQVMFLTGSFAAVAENDHAEAVKWFDKALPRLQEQPGGWAGLDVVTHGELFVSMGVSYWETNQRERAIELTESGVESLQQSVQKGQVAATVLTVPYGNLAAMHTHLGNTEKAQKFSELVARMQPPATKQR